MDPALSATELRELLVGRWSIERRLLARRTGEAGEFTGSATFELDGDGLSWCEQGRMRFAGYEGPARRRLAIVRKGDGWAVRFDDGRFFHPLDLSTGACAVEHLCGPDVYRGHYTLLDRDALDVRWQVAGPHKDDEIQTVYRRDAALGCRLGLQLPTARTASCARASASAPCVGARLI